MTLKQAISMYLHDMKSEGRITSPGTERAYGDVLWKHADDVGNRDPRTIGREDVKRTLQRWPHPNTQSKRRSILISFYRWTVEEGYRKDNPAEQTRRPKTREVNVRRLLAPEIPALLRAPETAIERRLVYLGLCAGLRRQELRGLKGLHFTRPGWVWVSSDIGKGGRERWVPVIQDLEPVIDEIVANVAPNHYVLPGQRTVGKSAGSWKDATQRTWVPDKPMGETTLYNLTADIGRRVGLDVHPHLLRHAFCDFVTRGAGVHIAQYLMGHADIGTTQSYLGAPTLDELAASVQGVSLLGPGPRATPLNQNPESQQYRYGDSNPGNRDRSAATSGDENHQEGR